MLHLSRRGCGGAGGGVVRDQRAMKTTNHTRTRPLSPTINTRTFPLSPTTKPHPPSLSSRGSVGGWVVVEARPTHAVDDVLAAEPLLEPRRERLRLAAAAAERDHVVGEPQHVELQREHMHTYTIDRSSWSRHIRRREARDDPPARVRWTARRWRLSPHARRGGTLSDARDARHATERPHGRAYLLGRDALRRVGCVRDAPAELGAARLGAAGAPRRRRGATGERG